MTRPRLFRVLAVSLLLAAASLFSFLDGARAQQANRMAIDQALVSESEDSMTVLVSVVDPAGQPVRGLTDFDVQVDGTNVEPRSVSPVVNQDAGIAVLLAVDISGSMAGEPLDAAKAAASAFVDGLLPQDTAALLAFAGSVPDSATYTTDRAALRSQIEALQPEGGTGTALYDAIDRALDVSAGAPTPRRAILLLTDGRDSSADAARESSVLERARQANVPIFAVSVGGDADTQLLEDVSSAAHGSMYEAAAPADVARIFDAVGTQLRSQYQIVIPIPNATLTSRRLQIQTNVNGEALSASGDFVTKPPNGDGGGGPPIWIWLVIALFALPVAILAGRRFFSRRRRRGPLSPLPGGPGADLSLPSRGPSGAAGAGPAAALLAVVEGPDAGREVRVTSLAIDVGSDAGCQLRLDAADGTVAPRHLRAWLQQGRLVVHHLAPGFQTYVGDSVVEWATLEPADRLRVGPYTLGYSLVQEPVGDVPQPEINASAEQPTPKLP